MEPLSRISLILNLVDAFVTIFFTGVKPYNFQIVGDAIRVEIALCSN